MEIGLFLSVGVTVGLLSGAELVLTYTTERAHPVFGQIFERCARSDAILGIACCGIVLVTADVAYILLHNVCCFLGFNIGVRSLSSFRPPRH